jgi:ATP-dependent RNA helicase DeaD
VEKIEQTYYEVPMGRKMDALNLILKYHNPKLSVIFCNTKKMVDEITAYLNKSGFFVEGLHGDMKQSQRTKVMESFKHGQTSILVATDVAARGIDVNDIDYVINYDIPQNYEYYVHRIGRTGRAGKSGKAITICSGRRQVGELLTIGRMVKSKIVLQKLPNSQDIQSQQYLLNLSSVEEAIENTAEFSHEQLVNSLIEKGIDTKTIALAVLEMHFGKAETDIEEIKVAEKPRPISSGGRFQKISISGGRDHRIAPNHIVGAITEKTRLSGKEIGKIEIFDDNSVVSVPESETDHVIESMKNCKINGVITNAVLVKTKDSRPPRSDDGKDYRQFKKRDRSDGRYKKRARF